MAEKTYETVRFKKKILQKPYVCYVDGRYIGEVRQDETLRWFFHPGPIGFGVAPLLDIAAFLKTLNGEK